MADQMQGGGSRGRVQGHSRRSSWPRVSGGAEPRLQESQDINNYLLQSLQYFEAHNIPMNGPHYSTRDDTYTYQVTITVPAGGAPPAVSAVPADHSYQYGPRYAQCITYNMQPPAPLLVPYHVRRPSAYEPAEHFHPQVCDPHAT